MEGQSQTTKNSKTQKVDSCADKTRKTFPSKNYPSKNLHNLQFYKCEVCWDKYKTSNANKPLSYCSIMCEKQVEE